MNKSGQRRTHGKPGKWWKVSCALLPAAFACETSEAQSSVTLYGIADTSVCYLSKADTAGNGRFLMGPGGLSESRWGIKGVEDLGGGWSTTFRLENRFLLNNGQGDPSMPFFNEAQIGLQSATYGHLVLGRQYNVMIEGVVMGGYSSNPWIPSDFNFQPEVTMTGGIRSSNQVQYHGKYKDFRISTAYSFSGNAGRMAYGSQYGVAAAYAPANGPFTLGGAFKETKDSINGSNGKAWTFGGSYTWDKTRFALVISSIRTIGDTPLSPMDRSPRRDSPR